MSKKLKYVGKEAQNLAQVGLVNPNQVITVDDKIAAQLAIHDPENYKPHVEPETPTSEPLTPKTSGKKAAEPTGGA